MKARVVQTRHVQFLQELHCLDIFLCKLSFVVLQCDNHDMIVAEQIVSLQRKW